MTADVLPAKRLVFDPTQWAALLLVADDVALPEGFETSPQSEPALAKATVHLLDSGVLVPGDDGPRVHPSVRFNLELFAIADIVIRTTATIRDALPLLDVHAVYGQLGASLLTNQVGFELSAWPASTIAHELARAVPDLPIRSVEAPNWQPVEIDFDVASAILAVAVQDPDAAELLATAEQVPPAATRQLLELTEDSRGSLQVLILRRPPSPSGTAMLGEVIWIGSDTGWNGLRLVSHLDGPPRLSWQHVEPADLGYWVAPAVMEALA